MKGMLSHNVFTLVTYLGFMRCYEKLMKALFGLQALEVIDNILMCDTKQNQQIVIGGCFVDKFDYESMRDHWLNKIDEIPEMRRKLVKRHGTYWLQEMSDEEWKIKRQYVIVKKDTIGSDAELCQYLADEQTIKEPYDHT